MYTNVSTAGNCIIITLPYRDKMTNCDKMSKDMNNYHYEIHKVEPSYKYLDIIEIGNHHTYHCHEIMILDHPPSLSECNTFQRLWHGKGDARIETIHE